MWRGLYQSDDARVWEVYGGARKRLGQLPRSVPDTQAHSPTQSPTRRREEGEIMRGGIKKASVRFGIMVAVSRYLVVSTHRDNKGEVGRVQGGA